MLKLICGLLLMGIFASVAGDIAEQEVVVTAGETSIVTLRLRSEE